MERNDAIPTAAERVAEALPRLRELFGGGKHLADAMTAIGVPTTISTISRIQAGKQPISLDETLALALLSPHMHGLTAVLQPPYRIGDIVISTPQDGATVRGVADEDLQRFPLPPGALGASDAWAQARNLTVQAVIRRTDLQLADALHCEVADVQAASEVLFGHPAHLTINERTIARTNRDPEPRVIGDTAWQAYRAHAVRTVTREISDYFEEIGQTDAQ